jgi:hypothetical protein
VRSQELVHLGLLVCWKNEQRVLTQKPLRRAQMPRPPRAEYSTAEWAFARNHSDFHQQKTSFLLMKMKFNLSGWLSVLPCCTQREAEWNPCGSAGPLDNHPSYRGFCVKILKKQF